MLQRRAVVPTVIGDRPHARQGSAVSTLQARSTAEAEVARFDFRRPSLLSREDVRGLELAHEVFTRRLASRWGGLVRALVQAEPLAVDQVPFDDYTRSMPTPNIVGTVAIPPLPGAALIEMNPQFVLLLVDRLLGGGGSFASAEDLQRRPSELEAVLVTDLLEHAVAALADSLTGLCDGAELLGVEYNPHHVQVAAPSDMVLILTYRFGLTQGLETEGLVSICYPTVTLKPILDQLSTSVAGARLNGTNAANQQVLLDRLERADVDLRVRLRDSVVPAADLTSLAVGDVLRLDHRVGQTVEGVVGDAVVLQGHPGRRGRRLALQVTDLVMPRRPLDLADPEPEASAEEPSGDLPAQAEPAPSESRARDRERSLA